MNDNVMIADHDVNLNPQPPKVYTSTLTPAEVRILRLYKSIAKPNKALGVGRYFIRSLPTIADAVGCAPTTVRRANDHFAALGILMWKSGNGGDWKSGLKGQPNQYSLQMRGWGGYDNPVRGITPAMLACVRRQLRRAG